MMIVFVTENPGEGRLPAEPGHPPPLAGAAAAGQRQHGAGPRAGPGNTLYGTRDTSHSDT